MLTLEFMIGIGFAAGSKEGRTLALARRYHARQ
jgi:hypothetical protein